MESTIDISTTDRVNVLKIVAVEACKRGQEMSWQTSQEALTLYGDLVK
jgi:hypothetical protein